MSGSRRARLINKTLRPAVSFGKGLKTPEMRFDDLDPDRDLRLIVMGREEVYRGFEPKAAGVRMSSLDQGYRVIVYGSEQGLRYRIPFRPVEEVIDYLRDHATEDGSLVRKMLLLK